VSNYFVVSRPNNLMTHSLCGLKSIANPQGVPLMLPGDHLSKEMEQA